MRYIDLEQVPGRLPEGWEERAARALEAVRLASGSTKEIEKRSAVWQDLKGVLAELSYDKCWYCEIKQTRSDNAVDHYRPKGPHRGGEHDGYWWLAFNWSNLRFSCGYCNSLHIDRASDTRGGKANEFPLFNPEQRARREEDDLSSEEPMLLDPTEPHCPTLLWFDPTGDATPRYSQEQNERLHRRAEVSIRVYHLNYGKTSNDRGDLFRKIQRKVSRGDKLFAQPGEDASGLRDLTLELLELIKPSAQFSAAARAFLLSFRDRPWVEGILAAA